ncbi:alpha/beta fold hydrolase [Ramlibacter sp. AW1]|uniref:Alpha/beta fold hydrolase n=1 Tax=Ramlibacter aurantiacus TaxID=2801330 RepID=A0A937D6B7_9BURK|nr:alpha/beta fold hydrolase [Ramlibacter aurantiacus]MBL0420788.1 alpha/beta fold hydrolase [Ramlibacter aurantiacus]
MPDPTDLPCWADTPFGAASIAVPGARLFVVDTGGGGTPLVLLHANTSTVESWKPQLTAFHAAGHRVIAFDRRGWGLSVAQPATGEQPGTIAQDLEALAGELGLDRFHLLGVAGGGFAALDYAAWQPSRVTRLIVAASNGQFSESEMQAFSARIAVPGLTGRLEVRPYLEVGAAYRAEDPDGFQRFIAMEHAARQPQAPAQPLRTPNTFAKVSTIAAPTLIVMAGADLLAPPALMRAWARHLPDARFAEIGDAGHSINWERPDAFNRIVLDFLAEPIRSSA